MTGNDHLRTTLFDQERVFHTGAAIPSLEIAQLFESLNYSNSRRLRRQPVTETGQVSYDDIDLTDAFTAGWPAIDQRPRNTCIAFAVASCVEAALAHERGVMERLSPEFLYWCMRNKPEYEPDPLPPQYDEGATKLSQASGVLTDLGICSEALAPYQRLSTFSKDPPSDEAFQDALGRKCEKVQYWDRNDDNGESVNKAEVIYQELLEGRAVAIGVPIFEFTGHFGIDNWAEQTTLSTGTVYGPTDSEDDQLDKVIVSAHAVCIVGFQPDKEAPDGGWFVFRNSWGRDFGKHANRFPDSPKLPGVGYGRISGRHVDDFCWEFLSLKMAD